MGGTEQPHMDKYMEITKDWNCDDSCTLTSIISSLGLKKFQMLGFLLQCVQENIVAEKCKKAQGYVGLKIQLPTQNSKP